MGAVLTEERREVILERLRRDGKVVATELSSSLAVSPDTVRRDLRELADAGLLRRVHGGALPPAVGARPVRGPARAGAGREGRDRARHRRPAARRAR